MPYHKDKEKKTVFVAGQIEMIAVKDLIPYTRNARTHSDEQVKQIAASIREFGWLVPCVIDEKNGLVAGHGRIMAAERLRLKAVPCVRAGHLTDEQRRAYVLADNKLALNAGWDEELLRFEIRALDDVGFNVEVIGFSEDELDDLFATTGGGDDTGGGEDTPAETVERRVQAGDLWHLGRHRVLCASALDMANVLRVIGNDRVDLVFADPPYGVKERTKRGENGRGNLTEGYNFEPIIGDDSIDTAVTSFHLLASLGAMMIFWGANYFCQDLPTSSSWLVWDKREGKGQDDNADCELAWTNRGGPARIFAHLWKGAIKASEHGERRVHPTQKPIALAEYCMTEFPKAKVQTVLDPFLGSGSTLMAATRAGRVCVGLELDPHYCDVIIARWEKHTGERARKA